MNERGQFANPDKSANKPVELDLSMVSDDDDFQCYFTGERRPVQTHIDDELQLLLKNEHDPGNV